MALNPKSLANLHCPDFKHGEPKRTRNTNVTDTAWQGLKELAAEHELSLAELLEHIGRRMIHLQVDQNNNKAA